MSGQLSTLTSNAIIDRLEILSLRRAAFTSLASLGATLPMLFVALHGGAPETEMIAFAGANIVMNLLRLGYGLAVLMMHEAPVSRAWVSSYRLISILINVSWIGIMFVVYQSLGIHSETGVFCLLITLAMIASAQSAFVTLPDVAYGTILGLGLGTMAYLLYFGTSIIDFSIAALAPVFSAFIAYNAHEFYSVLISVEYKFEEAAQTNILMKALLNATPGFMTLLNSECRYVMANDAFEASVGHSVIGRKLGFQSEDSDFAHLVDAFIASPDIRKMEEVKLEVGGKTDYFLVSLAKIEAPHHLIAVQSLNISDQKRVELELLKARSDAEHAGRLAALGEMISSVSHEIRNPLTVIVGRAAGLKKHASKGPLTEEQVSNEADKITAMVARINKIVEMVLKFSRGEANAEFSSVPVGILVDEALFLTDIKCKTSNVQVRKVEIDPELTVYCQTLQISQVLVNLVNNAVDALEGSENKWIQVAARKLPGQCAEIRVIDSGLGIPPEIRKRLMEPYFTTKAAGKGTGLGLSISRGIIEKHQGKMWIDADAPNTTFVIELPVEVAGANLPKKIA